MSLDNWLQLLKAEDFGASERDRKTILIGASVVGPLLIAVWCALIPWVSTVGWWLVLGGFIILVPGQICLVLLSLDRPQTLGAFIMLAEKQARDLRRREEESEERRLEAGRLFVLQSWLLTVYTMQAQAMKDPSVIGANISAFFEEIFFPAYSKNSDFFGFSSDDVWSFAVFVYDTEGKILRPVWRRCDPRHPSAIKAGTAALARSWAPGRGHVGAAFQRRREIITSDATQPELTDFWAGEANSLREYDRDVYKSFASIPFFDGAGDAEPIGVVVGSSSRIGAFNKATALPLRHAAAVFSTLGSVIKVLHNAAPQPPNTGTVEHAAQVDPLETGPSR